VEITKITTETRRHGGRTEKIERQAKDDEVGRRPVRPAQNRQEISTNKVERIEADFVCGRSPVCSPRGARPDLSISVRAPCLRGSVVDLSRRRIANAS
jgi:hypothetical protein